MKEHKTPLEYLKEHEGILPKTVGLAILCRLMEEYSDQQNAELMSEIERCKEVSELGKKSIRELIKANEMLESVESENAELRERVKELEGLLAIWVKQNNYLRRHSISDFDEVHDQTKKTLKK